MDIFAVITLFGGLAFFLYGMNVLSDGLESMAGSKLESSLRKMTSNRFKALALGAGITAAIQSSSAVTVMLVGLVNSGIMSISQSIGVIMGSNIGTTMTAWILTLAGVESENTFIKLLKPENFSLVFAFIGIILIMASKKPKHHDIGRVMLGFAVLMYGMKLMSSSVKPLAEVPEFVNLFTAFKNPILGVLVGLAITAIIQSSSASVGILQALALTGAVSFGAAIPIIIGQNIGTCVTALISSIGVSRNAKKVAVVHVAFNVIGAVVCLSVFCLLNAIIGFSFVDQAVTPVGIAIVHTTFNVVTTAMLIPFTGQLEALSNRVLKDNDNGEKAQLLDERLLATPSLALAECDRLTGEMAKVAGVNLKMALSCFDKYSEEIAEKIERNEDELDLYEDQLGTFLVSLSSKRLSQEDTLKISKMLHVIGDFERMGDHAENLLESAKELHDKKLKLSKDGEKEFKILREAICEIIEITEESYLKGDIEVAVKVEPLEQTIDKLVMTVRNNHIERLQQGLCDITMGFILSDTLNNLERVSDHCSNVAVAVIELSHNSFDTHKYISELRSDSEQFREDYKAYKSKYQM